MADEMAPESPTLVLGDRTVRTRPRPERSELATTVVARLVTTSSSSERLLRSVANGVSEYIVTSADASVAIRGRLSIESVQINEQRFGGGQVVIDWANGVVTNGSNRVSLSRTERRLLSALVEGNGDAVQRAALIARAWPGHSMSVMQRENALAVYICTLRKRLAAIGLGSVLCTVRGVGYRINL